MFYSFSLLLTNNLGKGFFMKLEEGIIGSEVALKSAHSHISPFLINPLNVFLVGCAHLLWDPTAALARCRNSAKLEEHKSAETEAELVFCESSVGVGNASNT